MSIAENDVRRGVSGGIGSLLPILPMFECEPLGLELPIPMKTGGDRAEWEDSVAARLAMLPAIPDAARGKAVRDRVLRAALFLERHGTVSHPSTRSQWRNIVSLLKLTACDADFWSPTGPVVGIDDAQLQERTGLQNPGRMFRQLEKHGLVMRWNSKRNGRRHWRRRFDGTVDASGWSLAPLIFLVDAIELLVDEEHERLRLRCELPQRITVALEAIRRILLSGAIGTEDAVLAEGKAADLAKERDNSRKGRLERLQAAAEHAEALLHGLLSQAIPGDRELQRDENGPVQRDESVPAHTNDHSTSVTVDGLAEGRSGDRGPSSQALEQDDRFGIKRSGFEWTEVPHLFPFIDGLVQIKERDMRRTAFAIGAMIKVEANTVDRAVKAIGADATALCLLIAGQHFVQGDIRRTTEIYFRGMLKRAREDDLNIGHTLFGRRESLGLHRVKSKTGPGL
ncbi:MAG: hypothetical protein KKC55_15115 [Gammaproteobacteria bacterium]|nr:hypothetical protein [Gammaproteobacteria bacterium]